MTGQLEGPGHLDQVRLEYERALSPAGWEVSLERGVIMPSDGEENCQLVFSHVLAGAIKMMVPTKWDAERIRAWIDPQIRDELLAVASAPAGMRHPGKVAAIRANFSAAGWDKETRMRVALLLRQLQVINDAEAKWLIRTGARTGPYDAEA